MFSIKYLVPFGGEDLDKVDQFFELTIAKGDESWTGIGETAAISPIPGDVIWQDASEVSTISLNHRQCEKTKLTEATTNAYFISEGLSSINKDHIQSMSGKFIDAFTGAFGGTAEQYHLDRHNSCVQL